jgi:hypothetical protein
VLGGESNRKTSAPPAIDVFQADNMLSLPYVCECEFYRGPVNGATTVFAIRQERTFAFAMVDGRLVTFQRGGLPANSSCRKNIRNRERWTAIGVAIVLDYRAVGSGEEACWFKGMMTVSVGKRASSIPVSGAYWC